MTNAVTTSRTAALESAERIIQAGIDGFMSVVWAFQTIREDQLYVEAGYTSFHDYLRGKWERAYAYRIEHDMDTLLSINVDDPHKLDVITKPAHATALAGVSEPLRPAVIEVLNATLTDKTTAKAVGRVGVVLEGIYEELRNTGALEVNEGDQLPASAITTLTSAALLVLEETNKRRWQHIEDARQKKIVLDGFGTLPDVAKLLGIEEDTAPIQVWRNSKGYTIRVERVEE